MSRRSCDEKNLVLSIPIVDGKKGKKSISLKAPLIITLLTLDEDFLRVGFIGIS